MTESSLKNDVLPAEILIIDDEEMICELLCDYFALENRRVICFNNPREGIEYYAGEKDRVGLVLLDMLMPELSGREVLSELVALNPSVRVLFLSGYADGLDREEAHRENIISFMAKPVCLEELKMIVDRELSSS